MDSHIYKDTDNILREDKLFFLLYIYRSSIFIFKVALLSYFLHSYK